ncbi:MAG TPA: hypothetical protein VK639_09685 [Terriglobales bacterium]|nr:hypothetical protein [Terriglobales bacterium]
MNSALYIPDNELGAMNGGQARRESTKVHRIVSDNPTARVSRKQMNWTSYGWLTVKVC